MLDSTIRRLVRSSAPLLREAGVPLMSQFYQHLLAQRPELKILFNETHLANGELQAALAGAAAYYAENIDDPDTLEQLLSHIAHRHASFGVRPEYYPILGEHLIAAIREALGEQANDVLIASWQAVYRELSDALMGLEAGLYREAVQRPGGFTGWRRFGVGKKDVECDGVVSLYLYPVDGGHVPDFFPGQYINVRGLTSHWDQLPPRPYSLSKAPNGHYLRITVLREDACSGHPAGRASTLLVNEISRGDEVEISAPFGDFQMSDDAPAVLVGAGIGVAPLCAMMEYRVLRQRPVHLVYSCLNGVQHPFRKALARMVEENDTARLSVFYELPRTEDNPDDYHFSGGLDLERAGTLDIAGAHYYLCGPLTFLRQHHAMLARAGVPLERRHHEVFGPDVLRGQGMS